MAIADSNLNRSARGEHRATARAAPFGSRFCGGGGVPATGSADGAERQATDTRDPSEPRWQSGCRALAAGDGQIHRKNGHPAYRLAGVPTNLFGDQLATATASQHVGQELRAGRPGQGGSDTGMAPGAEAQVTPRRRRREQGRPTAPLDRIDLPDDQ